MLTQHTGFNYPDLL